MGTLRRGRDEGAVAVELGLLLPILFLLLFGIIEFGIVFNRYTSVAHAAREGVRQLSIGKDVATAEAKGEGSAPDLAGSINCTGTPAVGGDVTMVCAATYDLSLWVFTKPVTLTSSAVMRKE